MTREHVLKVEEYRDGDALVIRAFLPRIDPEKDVDIDILDGTLRVSAERRKELPGSGDRTDIEPLTGAECGSCLVVLGSAGSA